MSDDYPAFPPFIPPQAGCELDHALYGTSFVDIFGSRIDPARVTSGSGSVARPIANCPSWDAKSCDCLSLSRCRQAAAND